MENASDIPYPSSDSQHVIPVESIPHRSAVIPFPGVAGQGRIIASPENWAARVNSLHEFISALEMRLGSIYDGQRSRAYLAHEVLYILRQILLRETGFSNVDEGGDAFFRKLWGERSIEQLFRDLFKEARGVLAGITSPGGVISSGAGKLGLELESILNWYFRRSMSLLSLEREIYGREPDDRIFSLTVLHDRTWCGLTGFEVSCGLRLVGYAHQHLWLKVTLSNAGTPVRVLPAGRYWVDESNGLVTTDGVVDEYGPVCALVPLFSTQQRLFLDTVRAFIPYSVLDAPDGKVELEVSVAVCDADGSTILEGGQLEVFSIPPVERAHVEALPLPSPQALGLWSADFVSGDSIREVRIRQGFQSERAQCEEVLHIGVDFDLYAHSGERVRLEYRVVRADGSLLSARSPQYRDSALGISAPSISDSSQGAYFLYRREFYPQRSIVRCQEIDSQIPLRAIDFPVGSNQQYYLEVSLLLENGRALCGTLQPFTVSIAQHTAQSDDSAISQEVLLPSECAPLLPVLDPYSGLTCTSLEVREEPETVPGIGSLDVVIGLSFEQWESRVFRVLCEISSPENAEHVFQRRILCVGGFPLSREQKVHFCFSTQDLSTYALTSDLETGEPDKVQLQASVKVLTLEDKVIFDLSRPFSCSVVSAAQKQSHVVLPEPLRIETILLQPHLYSKVVNAEIIFCVDLRSPMAAHGTIYYEFTDTDDNPLAPAGAPQRDGTLTGNIQPIDFSREFGEASYRLSELQMSYPVSLDVSFLIGSNGRRVKSSDRPSESPVILKVLLFAHDGRLVQVMRKYVRVSAGILNEALAGKVSINGPGNGSNGHPRPAGKPLSISSESKQQKLLSRLRFWDKSN